MRFFRSVTPQVSIAVGVVLWSVIYQELWAREEKVIAVKWGTSGFEEVEKDRYMCW